MSWENRRFIKGPSSSLWWASTGLGPCWAEVVEPSVLRLLVVGRDSENRSRIGEGVLNIDSLDLILGDDPVLDLGERGTFDFNGVAYPWLVRTPSAERLYYTGWTKGFHVSFINDLGVAERDLFSKHFKRHSRATILSRTDDEPFGTGSVCVLATENSWRMWYTSFVSWQMSPTDDKHYYHIRTATSMDGLSWSRPGKPCISFDEGRGEYAISRPSVLRFRDKYLMWFSVRGESYRIEFAWSPDGVAWTRMNDVLSLSRSDHGWDSDMTCYGHVVQMNDSLLMIYVGNGYGRSGFGVATLPLSKLDQVLNTEHKE